MPAYLQSLFVEFLFVEFICRVYLWSYSEQPFEFTLEHICDHSLELPAASKPCPALTLLFLDHLIWFLPPRRGSPLLTPQGCVPVPAAGSSARSTKRSHKCHGFALLLPGQGVKGAQPRWTQGWFFFSRQFHRHLINNAEWQREFLK